MKKLTNITDLKPDPQNANRGTPRGHGIIEQSIRRHGAGRSGLAAKDGTMIAGSQTLEEMAALGIPVRPVYTDGSEWVVVIREDVEPGSEQARLMAVEDNRASELGLDWEPGVLAELAGDGVDLGSLFTADEFAGVSMAAPNTDEWGNALGGLPDGDRAPFQQMTFTLSDEQAETVKRALKAAQGEGFSDTGNENSNGNALARIAEAYLG